MGVERRFDSMFSTFGMNLASRLPITDYRVNLSTEARSKMSTIKPQAPHNGQSAPLIVVRTVHGDSIAVRMEMLGKNANAHFSGESPKAESSQPLREAG